MKICGYVFLVTSVTMLTVKVAGNALYEGVRELTCSFEFECCTPSWRPVNISRLEDLLDSHLLGQHLARDLVIRSMRAHHRNPALAKPLVLSFHGWTGSGKTFVAQFVAESVYTQGLISNTSKPKVP